MKRYMKVTSHQYHQQPRLHVFAVRIVEESDDGKQITEGPIAVHGIHRKVVDEQYGGSWRKWLKEVVKEEMLDHWHAMHEEGHHQEIEQVLKEEL